MIKEIFLLSIWNLVADVFAVIIVVPHWKFCSLSDMTTSIGTKPQQNTMGMHSFGDELYVCSSNFQVYFHVQCVLSMVDLCMDYLIPWWWLPWNDKFLAQIDGYIRSLLHITRIDKINWGSYVLCAWELHIHSLNQWPHYLFMKCYIMNQISIHSIVCKEPRLSNETRKFYKHFNSTIYQSIHIRVQQMLKTLLNQYFRNQPLLCILNVT